MGLQSVASLLNGLPILVLFAIGVWFAFRGLLGYVDWLRNDPGVLPALGALALTIALAWCVWILAGWIGCLLRPQPRIVPYFSRRVGVRDWNEPFTAGFALYREIESLETLAATLGVSPLSTFGFRDEWFESMRWRSASLGLECVRALRVALEREGALSPSKAAEDLATMEHALKLAADQGIGFALVVRLYPEDGQGLANEVRKGSFQ